MLKNLLNLFFPKICSGCSYLLLENENTICVTCRHDLPLKNDLLLEQNDAFKKFYGRLDLEHASSMLAYHKKGIVQKLIHNLKYKNHQEIGYVLGYWYADNLKNIPALQNVDFIVPVPLHKKRFKERGYNQVNTFCMAISESLESEFEQSILVRNEYATMQSKKNLINRNSISETTFSVNFSKKHHNKHFLLIDDVLTTGATIEACGKAILKIPGSKLSIVTMAISQ